MKQKEIEMSTSKYADSEERKFESLWKRVAFLPDNVVFEYMRDYRDTNFYETFLEYFEGFNKFYDDEIIKNEDFGIVLGLILYPLFLVVDFSERWIPYYKKEMAKPIYSPHDRLDRNTQSKSSQFLEFVENENNEIVDRRAVVAKSIRNREEQGTLVDSYCPDKNKKATKVQAISSLRKYLYQNNFILKVNEVHRSMSFDFNEDLKSTFGKDTLESVFGEKELNSNLEITFGKDINEALSIITPSIVVLKNNSVEIKGSLKILEEKLSQLIQEEVKIEIVTDKVKNENGIKKKNSQLLINWDETISVIILAIGLIISRCIF